MLLLHQGNGWASPTALIGCVHLWCPTPYPTLPTSPLFIFLSLCLLLTSFSFFPSLDAVNLSPSLTTRGKTWWWFRCSANQSIKTYFRYLFIHALAGQLEKLWLINTESRKTKLGAIWNLVQMAWKDRMLVWYSYFSWFYNHHFLSSYKPSIYAIM